MTGLTTTYREVDGQDSLLTGQISALEMLAQGKPLETVLTACLEFCEAHSPDMLCSILLLDAEGKHLRHGAAPSLPDGYIKSIDGSPIGPAAGSCGTAAFKGEAVTVEDIATDPLWAAYKDIALPYGLRSCWSTPILHVCRGQGEGDGESDPKASSGACGPGARELSAHQDHGHGNGHDGGRA